MVLGPVGGPSLSLFPMHQLCCSAMAKDRSRNAAGCSCLLRGDMYVRVCVCCACGVYVAIRELASEVGTNQDCQLLAKPLLASFLVADQSFAHYRGYSL